MKKRFEEWLRLNGAEVLSTTNPYELARFIAQGKTLVVYENSRGRISANGFAEECWNAFRDGKMMRMGQTKKPRTNMMRQKFALLERDGDVCFFCGKTMGDDITVEHLVAHSRGGPNHQDNLVLAHDNCNTKAANIPLIEKIKMREKNIYQCIDSGQTRI